MSNRIFERDERVALAITANRNVASIQVDFHPATQDRCGVRANSRAAALLGLPSGDALVESLAKHNAPLPLPPLDAVRTRAGLYARALMRDKKRPDCGGG
jgi:hypothetical protein